MILTVNRDNFLNSSNQLIFVMVKCGVFFAVRTEFLNIISKTFSFKPEAARTTCGRQLTPGT
jgi:hypothetical protein